jgi:hypothetical protein
MDAVIGDHYFELKIEKEKVGFDGNSDEVELDFGGGGDGGNGNKYNNDTDRDAKRTKGLFGSEPAFTTPTVAAPQPWRPNRSPQSVARIVRAGAVAARLNT